MTVIRIIRRVLLLALPVAPALFAQTTPLSINGVISSGYYDTWTRGQVNQKVNFIPASAQFNITGYYMSPDFLNFTLQPELDYGPQAGEAGFQGGNGISMRITALRRRFPLTFRYSNVRVNDVFFGNLSQLSAYRLATRTSDLGLTWDLKFHNLPSLVIDWGRGSVGSQSGLVELPDYTAHVSHLNLDSKYEWRGWDIAGYGHLQRQDSDVFTPFGGVSNTSNLQQHLFQLQSSARKSIFSDSEIYLDAGRQTTSNLLLDMPINLTTSYSSANLRLFQRRKWKTSLRAAYSSNVSGQLLNRILSGIGNGGPGSILPDTSTLSLLERSISNINLNATTSYQLTKEFGFYGRADRSNVFSPMSDAAVNANYLTTSAGATYSKKFEWMSLSAQYGKEFGLGSVTGQTGHLNGDTYLASFQIGKAGSTQVDGSFHGSRQTIMNAQPISDTSMSGEASVVQPFFHRVGIRVGGGYQSGKFTSGGSDFNSNGYTGRFGIEHSRLQFNATLNSTLGSSLPLYSQLYGDIAVGSALSGLALRPIPSNLRALAFTMHATPIRKLEVSALWTHSLQHLDGVINNDFQILDAHVGYHFRRVVIDFGYTNSSQIFTTFTTYPETKRGRVYVRISRNAKIL